MPAQSEIVKTKSRPDLTLPLHFQQTDTCNEIKLLNLPNITARETNLLSKMSLNA
jgi:hypothetical protein